MRENISSFTLKYHMEDKNIKGEIYRRICNIITRLLYLKNKKKNGNK